jgi:predicted transport protein
MDQAAQTMIDNLEKNSGKSLDEWIGIVKSTGLSKHGEIIKLLKETHGLTHGYANLVVHKAKASDAGSAANLADLVTEQYKGKEALKPIYDQLMVEIKKFGADVEVAPKKAYVSLRRKKQFAMLTPATKTRFEIGINLKGDESSGVLEKITAANSMCSHKIKLESAGEISPETIGWLKEAYEQAG